MPNDYYNPTGTPGFDASGLSSLARTEFANIGVSFGLFPTLAGNNNKAVVVNGAGNSLVSVPQTYQMIDTVSFSSATASYSKTGLAGQFQSLILAFDLVPDNSTPNLNFQIYDNNNNVIGGTSYLGVKANEVSNATGSWPQFGFTNSPVTVFNDGAGVNLSGTFGGISGEVFLGGCSSSTYKKGYTWSTLFETTGLVEHTMTGFGVASTAQVGGVLLAFSSGNIASGKIRLLGVA